MTTNAATLAQPGNSVVAVYANHEQVEEAAKALQHQGYDMTKISVVGKDYHTEDQVNGFYSVQGAMEELRKLGAFWAELCGALYGSVVFLVPGVGPIVLAGPLTSRVMEAARRGAVVGWLGVICAALESIGIQHESARRYATHLQAGKFVLIVHGPAGDVERSRSLLEMTNHMGVDEYVHREVEYYEPW
jgi:hypothetical protein